MTSTRRNFDPIGIVVDWLDACRARHLSTLIDLYDDAAIIDCCQGGSFHGRLGIDRYWRPIKKTAPKLCPPAGKVALRQSALGKCRIANSI